jgi:hypothetical protein
MDALRRTVKLACIYLLLSSCILQEAEASGHAIEVQTVLGDEIDAEQACKQLEEQERAAIKVVFL